MCNWHLTSQVAYECFSFTAVPQTDLKHFNLESSLGFPWLPQLAWPIDANRPRRVPRTWVIWVALGLLCLSRPQWCWSQCLVSSVISWMPKPAAAHVQDLPMCVLAALIVGKALVNVPRCSQQTQTCRVICVIIIRRVKASTSELATRACQCMQLIPFVKKTAAFMPTSKFLSHSHLNARPPSLSRGRAIRN